MKLKLVLSTLLLSLAASWPAVAASPQPSEDQLLDVLKSNVPTGKKADACRELRTAGTEKSVPVLAGFLTDEQLSHSARIALEPMPYPSANAALREAAGKTGGLVKAGILDSLGWRRDPQDVPLLAAALKDKDRHVVAAAARALGRIATRDAADALLLALDKQTRSSIGEAAVQCLYRLQGDKQRARGDAQSHLPLLAAQDAMIREAAAGHLTILPLDELRKVAGGMSQLPSTSQVAVLMAVRIRGDFSFAPTVTEAVKSKDDAVRIAAVRALGCLGDASVAPLLLQIAAGQDPAGEAALKSLAEICNPQVDETIIAAEQAEKDPAKCVRWIGLLESRQTASAVPALLQQAVRPEPEVRSRAVAALGKLAGAKDIPGMIQSLLKAENGPQRDQIEKAVALVCLQIADAAKRAELVRSLLDKAAAGDRAALLPLVGRIGGAEARQAIESALNSRDPAIYEAGVRALCNWPDASVAEQLLKRSQAEKSAEHRLWALRAFIRVAALPGGNRDAEKLAMLKQAMQLAGRDEERGLVLERAAAVRTVQTLRFVAPYLNQPALAPHACKAVVELAHHKELRDPNKADFRPSLEKVIAISKDAALVERARRYLQAM